MKTNKPINKTITIDGEEKTFLLDRLAVVMSINAQASINAPITQSVLLNFKKCSSDGWIFNDEEFKLFEKDIMKSQDEDIQICVGKIEAALTEYVNKKGL